MTTHQILLQSRMDILNLYMEYGNRLTTNDTKLTEEDLVKIKEIIDKLNEAINTWWDSF